MTTSEIEALYIKHADDFRLLLGFAEDSPCRMAVVGDLDLSYAPKMKAWLVTGLAGTTVGTHAALAVAAMDSAWRERLEKEHEVLMLRVGHSWFPVRHDWPIHPDTNNFRPAVGFIGRDCGTGWDTLPMAICAAVAALAAEKRAKPFVAPAPFDWVQSGEQWQLVLPGNGKLGAVGEMSRRIAVCWASKEDRDIIQDAFKCEAGMEKMGFERVEAKPADHPKSEPPQAEPSSGERNMTAEWMAKALFPTLFTIDELPGPVTPAGEAQLREAVIGLFMNNGYPPERQVL